MGRNVGRGEVVTERGRVRRETGDQLGALRNWHLGGQGAPSPGPTQHEERKEEGGRGPSSRSGAKRCLAKEDGGVGRRWEGSQESKWLCFLQVIKQTLIWLDDNNAARYHKI